MGAEYTDSALAERSRECCGGQSAFVVRQNGGSMDLEKALRELYEEKKRIDRAIARLESRLTSMSEKPQRSRRGRKSMSAEERLIVSERMTAYWAARRARSEAANSRLNSPVRSEPIGNGVGA
jgi:hypothetical protein